MSKAKVIISGRDAIPCARLLEALTRSDLLHPDATWTEDGNSVIVEVPNIPAVTASFEEKRFIVVKPM